MKILVDEMPDVPNECLFSIYPSFMSLEDKSRPNCKLLLRTDYDMNNLHFTISNNGYHCTCPLSLGEECPCLKGKEEVIE